MKIVVGFSKPIKFKLHAWLIEKIDRAPFDHAYIKFHSDTFNRDIIYQATAKGVEFMGTAVWNTTTEEVEEYTLEIDDAKALTLIQYCIDNAGISYGLFACIGAGFVRLGWCKKNPFKDGPNSAFCSEIVARCLDQVGYEIDPDSITPKELRDILASR